MALSDEHSQAFDEAYALSGALVTIAGTGNIKAVLPLDGSSPVELDSDGVTTTETTRSITVLTAALPSISRTSIVDISGTEYRITETAPEGAVCTRLELISP